MLVNLSAMRLQLLDVLGYLLFTMCVLQLAVTDCCDGVCWNMLYFSVRPAAERGLSRCSRWKALEDRPTFPGIPRIPVPNYDIHGAEAQHPPLPPQHQLQTHTWWTLARTHKHVHTFRLASASIITDERQKVMGDGGRRGADVPQHDLKLTEQTLLFAFRGCGNYCPVPRGLSDQLKGKF